MVTPEIVAAIVGLLGGVISIASAFTAARMYAAKRNADGKLLAQSQSHERAMTELTSKQSGETNLSAALLSVAKAMQAQTDIQAASNSLAADERKVANTQAKAFTDTMAASAMAQATLAGNISAHTEAVATNTATTNTSASAVGELATKVDNLRNAIETTLQRMESGAQEWREVKSVLQRVIVHLDKQSHDNANGAQLAAVATPPENGSGD